MMISSDTILRVLSTRMPLLDAGLLLAAMMPDAHDTMPPSGSATDADELDSIPVSISVDDDCDETGETLPPPDDVDTMRCGL